jgi:hypothetical protein
MIFCNFLKHLLQMWSSSNHKEDINLFMNTFPGAATIFVHCLNADFLASIKN